MPDHERVEKYIIAFLCFALLAGIGVGAYRRSRVNVPVTVERSPGARTASSVEEGRVNINTASEEELVRLKGVGKTGARRIIEYRDAHGGFSSAEELKKVKGVGARAFSLNREAIAVRDGE